MSDMSQTTGNWVVRIHEEADFEVVVTAIRDADFEVVSKFPEIFCVVVTSGCNNATSHLLDIEGVEIVEAQRINLGFA